MNTIFLRLNFLAKSHLISKQEPSPAILIQYNPARNQTHDISEIYQKHRFFLSLYQMGCWFLCSGSQLLLWVTALQPLSPALLDSMEGGSLETKHGDIMQDAGSKYPSTIQQMVLARYSAKIYAGISYFHLFPLKSPALPKCIHQL